MKSTRKKLKTGEVPEVENALYLWFLQEHNRHTLISGRILKEKAMHFYKKNHIKMSFKLVTVG